jgi:hypothetical protein
LALAAGVVFVVAACGAAAPGTSLAPGQTPGTGSTPVPPPPIDVSQMCAGMPTYSPQTPTPVFLQDDVLNAKFPTTVDGQPVTNIRSTNWLQSVCYSGNATESLQRFAAIFGAAALPGISTGSASATVDGDTVSISAFRIAGTDANAIFTHFTEFAIGIGISPTEAAKYAVSQGNVGGKNVYIVTDPDGDKSYDLVSGDSVFSIFGSDEAQAATVLAAFP